MAEPLRPALVAYVLPGNHPREKYVFFLTEELPLTEEAQLWIGAPVEEILGTRGRLCTSHSLVLQAELDFLEEIHSADEVDGAISITAFDESSWPSIYAGLKRIIAEMNDVHLDEVVLRDVTNDDELNLYVFGVPGTTVRYFAPSHRPLLDHELRELLEHHRFEPATSVNDAMMHEHHLQILSDIQDLPDVDESSFEADSLLFRITAASEDWDQIIPQIINILADHIHIPIDAVRVHELATE